MKRALQIEEARLLNFARRYLSEAFPNPQRMGCPTQRELRLMALQPQQADESVSDHLTFCSPCFTRYMDLLAELRQEQQAQKQPSWKERLAWHKTSPLWIGSAVMVIGFLAMSAYFVTFTREIPSPDVAPPPIATGPSAIEYSAFELDLRGLSPTRAPASTDKHPVITMPRKPLEISFLLPVGSEEGQYRVSLRAKGKTLWTAPSEALLVQQRTTLRVRVNLTGFPPGSYTVDVESESGFQLRQPIVLRDPETDQEGRKQ